MTDTTDLPPTDFSPPSLSPPVVSLPLASPPLASPRLSKVDVAMLVGSHGQVQRAGSRRDDANARGGDDRDRGGADTNGKSEPYHTAPVGRTVPSAVAATEDTRVRIGAARDTPPDVLAALAVDPAVTVRAAVAMNSATPTEADTRLARDSDERVRSLLARKVAALIPHLPADERAHLQARALAVLQALVADEAVRVREAIADVVKEMPEAPRDLIMRLARDGAFSVSEPVIRLSPLLSSQDLLAILAAPPVEGAEMAVARRNGLDAAVSDAIAEGADAQVITALLTNHSANIREATLDSLVSRASSNVLWHEPMVKRPMLTNPAIRALSQIVATHLLKTLSDRVDLNRETAAELRLRLADRLQSQQATRAPELTADAAMLEARGLNKADLLNERKVLEAVMRGDSRRTAAMLAVSANVELQIVERAAQVRNAKGLVSLVWRAGFTMRLGVALQGLLAGLGPDAVLRPTCSGGFPLAIDEMRWHLDCLVRGTR